MRRAHRRERQRQVDRGAHDRRAARADGRRPSASPATTRTASRTPRSSAPRSRSSPTRPLLYDDLTVRQHLELVALSHGVAGDGIDDRIDALLDRLGLGDRDAFVPRELSRGMRQKAQLACALIRPAALLVLDEPVVGLDPPSQVLLYELLLEAKRAGTAVLLTTHQMGFADGLADRAVMLDEGEVADEGPWAEVRERAEARGWISR